MPHYRKAALTSAAFFHLSILGGCSLQPWQSPQERAEHIAREAGFETRKLVSGEFLLTTHQSADAPAGDILTVYIEGDGAPWIAPHLPPGDPTPINPVGLMLATRDPRRPVVHVARPCQYLDRAGLSSCHYKNWTTARFSPPVIASIDGLVDRAKREHKAARVRLVGFSGGGVIAALVAIRRQDVDSLVTIAAPLDVAAWAAHHRITPLDDSLNPADFMPVLSRIPQVHLVGEKDPVVPTVYVKALQERMPFARFTIIPHYTHECCWAETWRETVFRAPK